MNDDVTIAGYVLRATPSDRAWVFRPEERPLSIDQVVLPKSQVKVVRGQDLEPDQVTMPRWLAKQKGLLSEDPEEKQIMSENEVSRSAESGQFVSAEEAAAHPETTVTETMRSRLYPSRTSPG